VLVVCALHPLSAADEVGEARWQSFLGVLLSEEVAAATDESKDHYSCHEVSLAIGVLRLAFAKPGEHSLSMTPQ
jgi:hypothetical protein